MKKRSYHSKLTASKQPLSIQKSTSDHTGLGYDFSSSNIDSTSAIVFVPPSNNVEIENNIKLI